MPSRSVTPWTVPAGRHAYASQSPRVDISQQKAVQDWQSILVRELDHRIKNNPATIQAISSSTIRKWRTMDIFSKRSWA
jgi:two-component sensor histidine kinase